MKNESDLKEAVKTPESETKEPMAEVLGHFKEVSRGKHGGSDAKPYKHNQ